MTDAPVSNPRPGQTGAPVAARPPMPPRQAPSVLPAALAGLSMRLRTLGVLRGALSDPVVQKLLCYLDVRQANAPLHACVSAYADFVALLYEQQEESLSGHLLAYVARHDDPHARIVARGGVPSTSMTASLEADLRTLQAAADLTPAALREGLAWSGSLPEFEVVPVDLAAAYRQRG